MILLPQTKRRSRAGFTMVELLAVMAIIAIMLSLTVLNISSNSNAAALRSSIGDLRAAAMLARQYAMTKGAPAALVFMADARVTESAGDNSMMNTLYPNKLTRLRYLRAYAVYSWSDTEEVAVPTGNEPVYGTFVTEWKFLSNNIIFDVQRNDGGRNALINESCSFVFNHYVQAGGNVVDGVRLQALKFLPDGSLDTGGDTSRVEVFVVEGSTNAEEIDMSNPLAYFFGKTGAGSSDTDTENRIEYGLEISPLTGGFRTREYY